METSNESMAIQEGRNKEWSPEDRLAWLSLKLIPGLGNRSLLRLYRHFGSPSVILKARRLELAQVPDLTKHAARALLSGERSRPPRQEWEALKERRIRILCLGDPDYPANLAAVSDPPAVLFVRGALESRDLVSVAVVGSRFASMPGLTFTEKLCRELAEQGVTVVSGLAVGIDGAAHRGALKGNGRTLAALGCGLDMDYPRPNADLRERIPRSGALITEFPLGIPPAAGHFPLRNRIISGLSLGVVVVEAGERSGSLITARLALEQGREVFAVPGLARHHRSVGPHRLLRDGAKLVETVEDILEEIRPLMRPSRNGKTAAPRRDEEEGKGPEPVPKALEETTSEEASIRDLLDHEPRHMDEICRALQWPVSRVMTVLLSMELKGMVKQLPGKYFVRGLD